MKRREFIAGLAGATAWPLTARAQQATGRVKRVGIVMPYAKGDTEYEDRVHALREELAKLGWTEGVNVQFDERWTTDNMDQVRANAVSLLALNPDAVVAIGGRVIPILMQNSRVIPIVVPGAADPVGIGWVESLARPGGNVTGFTFFELSMFGKMLETLKEIAPSTVRVAFISNPNNPNIVVFRRMFETSAVSLAIEPTIVPIHGVAEIERAVATLVDRPNVGLFFPPDITISALREEIITIVGRHRLPAIYSDPIFPKIGGLAFYGTDRIDMFRRAASYVDRILRGEKPGELPFQQPTKYQLSLNLKAAKTIGLDIPPTLLARADEVIE